MLTIKKVISPDLHDSPPKAARSQAVEAASLKVLIVDDHFLVREALCDLLKELKSNAIVMEKQPSGQFVTRRTRYIR